MMLVEIRAPRVEGGGEDGEGNGGRPYGQRRSWRASEVRAEEEELFRSLQRRGGGGSCRQDSDTYKQDEKFIAVIGEASTTRC